MVTRKFMFGRVEVNIKRKNKCIKTQIYITKESDRNPLLSFYTAIDLDIMQVNEIKIEEKRHYERKYAVKHLPYSKIRKLVTNKEEVVDAVN